MRLKMYQEKVLDDLKRFLTLLEERQDIRTAYRTVWEEKGIRVNVSGQAGAYTKGSDGVEGKDYMPDYQETIPGVPRVCIKVPTGGGKTFLAANAIRPVFDSMSGNHPKAVVWLVPSDAILKQTVKALQNREHFYRRKIDMDFNGAVEVYTKEELMNGQNFSPVSVMENLSVFVLSYDSFRTSKKEGRKSFQGNGALLFFSRYPVKKEVYLPDVDETALIQVIRQLNPVVIVDESHHAVSKLSREMLQHFNPSFILELTATPKSESNVISFVDARQLKMEDMVKLPVIVYNRRSQNDVLLTAVALRKKLEDEAERLEHESGRYIRPIVLFQAEARINEESKTFEKVRKELIEMGIPEEEIAIKTADRDDLKSWNLQSKECPVRYIITVNALKEGWDCPFAYVLATIANRSSVVEVEQIVGRILRLPYTKKNENPILNLSYVITSSSDFFATCNKVVDGLKVAGFTDKDYRSEDLPVSLEQEGETIGQEDGAGASEKESDWAEAQNAELEQLTLREEPVFDTEALKGQVAQILQVPMPCGRETDEPVSEIMLELQDFLQNAAQKENACQEEIGSAKENFLADVPPEMRDAMKIYKIRPEYEIEVSALKIPQFVIPDSPSLFQTEEYSLLDKEDLYADFTLADKDTKIDFSVLDVEMAKVDIEENENTGPKAWRMQGFDSAYMKEWFDAQPSEKKRRICKGNIIKRISKMNAIYDGELDEYVTRVMRNMSEDQLTDLEHSEYLYSQKIYDKIKSLLHAHAKETFEKWIEQDYISCLPYYSFAQAVTASKMNDAIPKSLYMAEEGVNGYESKVAWELSALPNIKWWHRNIARKGFVINGPSAAYPDLIVMTQSEKILLIETKGDHLKNDESEEKAGIGAIWAAKASMTGRVYKYFMVYETKNPKYAGAYSHERFMEIVKGL